MSDKKTCKKITQANMAIIKQITEIKMSLRPVSIQEFSYLPLSLVAEASIFIYMLEIKKKYLVLGVFSGATKLIPKKLHYL